MIFKPSGPFSRSGSVAKNLWPGGSGQKKQVPPFFISTPQFKRQQSQVVPYKGEARHQNGSTLNAHPSVVASSMNFSTTSVLQSLDDDRVEDEATSRSHPRRAAKLKTQSKVTREFLPQGSSTSGAAVDAEDDFNTDMDSIRDRSVEATPAAVAAAPAKPLGLDEAAAQMAQLQSAGEHGQALGVFTDLEQTGADIPIGIYNQVLMSLAALSGEQGSISLLLEAYERLLERDIVPNKETYAIIIGALVDMAEKLAIERDRLMPALGPVGHIEAVDEVVEQFAVRDHLRLAIQIFTASVSVDGAKFSQEHLDRLVIVCDKHDVPVDADLLARATPSIAAPAVLRMQRTVELAQETYQEFKAAGANPESLDSALIDVYFRLDRADLAVRTLKQAGSTPELTRKVVLGFASSGLVSTAWRWIREGDRGLQTALTFDAKAEVLQVMCTEPDHLPTAALLYEHLAAQKDAKLPEFAPVRAAVLRLAAGTASGAGMAVMRKIIRESHLRDASWDAVTVQATVGRLLAEGYHMLALDIFVWQARKLEAAWETFDVQSYIGQELLDSVVGALPELTPELALLLVKVPFLVSSFGVLEKVATTLWAARRESPRVFIDANMATAVLDLHNRWVLGAESQMGLALPTELVEQLREIYPLIEADAGVSNHKVRALLGLESAQESSVSAQPSSLRANAATAREDALAAIHYAGIDAYRCLDLLTGALALSPADAGFAVVPIFDALARDRAVVHLETVYELAERYLRGDELAAARQAAVQAADIAYGLAERAHVALIAAGSAPCATGYAQLVQAAPQGATPAVLLLNEARAHGVTPNTFLYNVVLSRLAKAKRFSECDELFAEMAARGVERSDVTYGTMISAACRADQGERAAALFAEFEKLQGYTPKVAPYNMMMQYYVHTRRDRAAALQVFEKLKASGAAPSPYSYQLAMEAWLLAPVDVAQADQQLLALKHRNTPVTTKHFATLLHARGVLLKDLPAAVNFYRGLVKNSRVLPDRHVFKALLESYVANSRTGDTPKVLDEMSKYHVKVDTDMLKTLIKGWSEYEPARAAALSSI